MTSQLYENIIEIYARICANAQTRRLSSSRREYIIRYFSLQKTENHRSRVLRIFLRRNRRRNRQCCEFINTSKNEQRARMSQAWVSLIGKSIQFEAMRSFTVRRTLVRWAFLALSNLWRSLRYNRNRRRTCDPAREFAYGDQVCLYT